MIIENINSQTWPQTKFVIIISIFQVLVAILFCIFVRYDASIDPKFAESHSSTEYDPYPCKLDIQIISNEYYCLIFLFPYSYFPFFSNLGIMDIQVMLFVGFGFLMTFLPRFGYSAVCFTMIITVVCVEWCILVTGFINMDSSTMEIPLSWMRFGSNVVLLELIKFSFKIWLRYLTLMYS